MTSMVAGRFAAYAQRTWHGGGRVEGRRVGEVVGESLSIRDSSVVGRLISYPAVSSGGCRIHSGTVTINQAVWHEVDN